MTGSDLTESVSEGCGSHLRQQNPREEVHPNCTQAPVVDWPSIIDIKKAIPGHCFRSSLPLSIFYIFKDFLIITCLWVFVRVLDEKCESSWLPSAMLYPVYWFSQGTMFWAVFVLGHDCGHGSFSNYPFINDVLGNFLHAFILVPYYPWKLSHKNHHKNTGNIDKDEIFYPVREHQWDIDMHPLPAFGLGISWFYYLFHGYPPRPVPHVNPFEKMLRVRLTWCCVSILSVLGMLALLMSYAYHKGVWCLLNHYAAPCFVFASWLVVVTFLHHSDVQVPWYANDVWTNVKGQLSSVDRDYGWAHDLIHNIGTHQIHHLFTKIPHYHLEEATTAFRKTFPSLVRTCDQAILPAFWRMFNIFMAQRHIHDYTEVHVYSDH